MQLIEGVKIPREPQRIGRSGRFKAELRVVESGPARRLYKSFASHGLLFRIWGRVEIARESKAYDALRGLPFVPANCERIDAWTIAMEYVDGCELIHHPERFSDGERFAAELEDAIAAMHRRGVVHLDLGGRHNLLVDLEGRLRLIDFAGAWCVRPGGPGDRWLRPWLARIDRAALLKWRRILLLPLAKGDWKRSAGHRRASRWWWLNRKRR